MGLLTREAEKSGVQPIVVGGSAVDIYTEGIYPSQDIDLVSNRKIIGEILVALQEIRISLKLIATRQCL